MRIQYVLEHRGILKDAVFVKLLSGKNNQNSSMTYSKPERNRAARQLTGQQVNSTLGESSWFVDDF